MRYYEAIVFTLKYCERLPHATRVLDMTNEKKIVHIFHNKS